MSAGASLGLLDDAVAWYFECLDRGESVDEGSFVARFPQLAAELKAFLASEQQLNCKVRQIAAKHVESNLLTVRCPSCYQPTEVAVDSTLKNLACLACGSCFSLVDQTATPPNGTSLLKVGRFGLTERVGIGAFGSVWKAYDDALDRTVAVKIPREGGLSADEQEKFFREARAAAQLRHPHIVCVHEVGRDGNSIYIVSDFVQGVTLADWLTGQQLTNHEATALCATIADALVHAHEKGVVHRDLKPANILIDADCQPHITDFGLARRDAGEVTVTLDGHLLGTPAYMSPEQAEGRAHEADRRSDVYSLGVILFQLLTGELPFRGNARMILHHVIHDEPPSPRTFNANIKRDLETIALKCLEKDPRRRYQSAIELSAELRRFQRGEPINGRPVGRVERGWRWCRRNQLVAALAGSLLLALITISVVGPVVAIRQSALRQQAEQNAHKAETEAAKSQQVATFLTDMLEGVGPSVALGRDTTMLREILDKTGERLNRLENQPEVEAELRHTLGSVYLDLAELPKAERTLRPALALRQELFGDTHPHVASTMALLGLAVNGQNRIPEGEELTRKSLAIKRSLYGNDHLEVAASLINLGNICRWERRNSEAESCQREALAIQRKLLGDHHTTVAETLKELAGTLAQQGELAEAEIHASLALEIQRELLGQQHPEIADTLGELSMIFYRQDKLSEAEATRRENLAMRRALLPNNHRLIVLSLTQLAQVLRAEGKFDEAEAALRDGLIIHRKMRSPFVFAVYNQLVDVLKEQEKWEELQTLIQEGKEIQKENPEAAAKLRLPSLTGAPSSASTPLPAVHD